VNGLAIYLDNWAVIDLAEGDPSRRKRFVDAVCTSGDILFSEANAAELSGPRGQSVDTIRTFLDELGPHWFPVELNPMEVVEREQRGKGQDECCVSTGFMHAYFRDRTNGYSPRSGKIIDLSPDFFRLGAVLDWVVPHRNSIREMSAKFDEVVKNAVSKARTIHEQNPVTAMLFNPSKPATFTTVNLVRTLLVESGQLKPGDGLDFCHAIMGSAFANFATLDKHWKRRVEGLPKPNSLARIYSAPDLDKMVTDIEFLVKQKRRGVTA
jgi:hypothetical protein